MNLSYLFRLLCICSASFFLIHTAVAMMVWAGAPAAIRRCESIRPRRAALLLFTLRLLPPALAAFVVTVLCVPSYLRFEPEAAAERTGLACCIAALLGAAACAISLWHALRGVARSLRCGRQFRREGREIRLAGESSPALLLNADAPLMALAGVFFPRIVVSSSVLQALSNEQLEAALLHERAHRVSHDNLKRLLLLLAPQPFLFSRRFAALEYSWARFTEWAGDDDAAGGNPQRSLSLAAALVSVARLGAVPPPSPFFASLVADGRDLSARVNRLLAPKPLKEGLHPTIRLLAVVANFAVFGILLAAATRPSVLHLAHHLLEELIG
jgi:Zn-dependent protease with chaperone function